MSTTSVVCVDAASSRTDRSRATLVTSISSGAVTTGTPLIISTVKLASGICGTSCGCERGLLPRCYATRPTHHQDQGSSEDLSIETCEIFHVFSLAKIVSRG